MVLQQLAGYLLSQPTVRERLTEWLPFVGNSRGHARGRRSSTFGWQRGSDPDIAAAHALGWTSVGIGLSELIAPQQVLNLLGVEDRAEHRGIVRVLGKRELAHGAAILVNGDESKLRTGVWSRVAGDTLDCALLGAAATMTKRPASFAVVAAMVTAIGVADLVCALRLSSRNRVR